MKLITIIIACLLISCNNKPGTEKRDVYPTYTKDLEDSIRTLDLQYVAWACACANWATPGDIDRYTDTGQLSDHSVFTEPADSTLNLPDTLGYNGDLVRFTGQFYKEKGYPKNYLRSEESTEKARVFRYTHYKIIRSNYRNVIKDTGTCTK